MSINTPFFIVGSVRSGTTLLRLLLGHHPHICKCEEMDYITPMLANSVGWPKLTEFYDYLSMNRAFRMTQYTIDYNLSFDALAESFLQQRLAQDNRPIVGAVVHHHFSELPRIWPNARFIFLLRDPRDVARSCVQMGWVGTPWRGADFWLDSFNQWQRLKGSIGSQQYLEIRFEDLIASPQETLQVICKFLGVGFEPSMLEIERDTTYKRPSAHDASSWRRQAKPAEIRQIETKVGASILKLVDYPPSAYPPLSCTFFSLLRISVLDILKRSLFRIRRYGWKLWISSVLARKLRLKGTYKRLKLAIDEIDTSHLK